MIPAEEGKWKLTDFGQGDMDFAEEAAHGYEF
jgi:hypothetical protein